MPAEAFCPPDESAGYPVEPEPTATVTRLPTAAAGPVEQGVTMTAVEPEATEPETIESVSEAPARPDGQMYVYADAAPERIESVKAKTPRNPAGAKRDDFEDFPRDGYKRPKIIRAEWISSIGQWVVPKDANGEPIKELVPFTRASTLGSALEYQAGLHRWKSAVVAYGVANSRTLGKRVRAVGGYSTRAQKDELYEIVDKAKAFAESDAAANHGTALHSLFQRIAEGETVQQLIDSRALDDDDVPAVQAFADALSRWDVLYCERRVVCDEAQAAGKYDLIVTARRPMPVTDKAGNVVDVILPGMRVAVDNKTASSADFFGEKFCVQLWIYANGRDYDQETGERTEVGCHKRWALILHVPSGTDEETATAEWHWVDLAIGEKLVRDARAVLEDRKLGKRAIIKADLDADIPPELLELAEARQGERDIVAVDAVDAAELVIDGVDGSGLIVDREQAREWFSANAGRTVGELADSRDVAVVAVVTGQSEREIEAGVQAGLVELDPMFTPGEILPDGRTVEDVIAENDPRDAELIEAIAAEMVAAEVVRELEAGQQKAALLAAIAQAGSVDALTKIYQDAGVHQWTPEVNRAAKQRRHELEAGLIEVRVFSADGHQIPIGPIDERPAVSASMAPIRENLGPDLQRLERDRVIVRTIMDATTLEQLLTIHARLVELELWPGKFQALMTERRQTIEAGRARPGQLAG